MADEPPRATRSAERTTGASPSPGLMRIRDEAATTPRWITLLALGLLIGLGGLAVYRALSRPEPTEPPARAAPASGVTFDEAAPEEQQ